MARRRERKEKSPFDIRVRFCRALCNSWDANLVTPSRFLYFRILDSFVNFFLLLWRFCFSSVFDLGNTDSCSVFWGRSGFAWNLFLDIFQNFTVESNVDGGLAEELKKIIIQGQVNEGFLELVFCSSMCTVGVLGVVCGTCRYHRLVQVSSKFWLKQKVGLLQFLRRLQQHVRRSCWWSHYLLLVKPP